MGAYATSHFDHAMVAYHNEALDDLFPLDTSLDAACWWTSQFMQSLDAALRFRGHVLVAKTVVYQNVQHRYKERLEWESETMHHFRKGAQRIRASLPQSRHHCVDAAMQDLKVGTPWGEPARKLDGVRYDRWQGGASLDHDCNVLSL